MTCPRRHTLVTGCSSGIGRATAGLDGLVNNAGYGLACPAELAASIHIPGSSWASYPLA